jgi:hypothetical protein
MRQAKGLQTKNEKAEIKKGHKLASDIKANSHETTGYKTRTGCTWNPPKSTLEYLNTCRWLLSVYVH